MHGLELGQLGMVVVCCLVGVSCSKSQRMFNPCKYEEMVNLLLDQNQLLLASLLVEILVQMETENVWFILLNCFGEVREELDNLNNG